MRFGRFPRALFKVVSDIRGCWGNRDSSVELPASCAGGFGDVDFVSSHPAGFRFSVT